MAGRIETLLTAERRLLLDISHELRSPLARLGVAVELARSGDDLEAALNRIQKESDRLNALVGQLLQVTRAEGDPSSLRRDPVRLDELVQQLVDDSAHRSRGARLRAAIRPARAGDRGGRPGAAAPRRGERDSQRHPLCAAANPPWRSRWRATTARRWWMCATTVRACRRRRCRGCSTPSTAWRATATALQRRHRPGAFHRAPRHRAAQGHHPRAQRAAGAGGGDGAAGGQRGGVGNRFLAGWVHAPVSHRCRRR